MSPMATHDILAIWLPVTAVIVACRVVPIFALRGRALPPRVVVIVAKKMRSMLWCCIAGVVAYVALGALPL